MAGKLLNLTAGKWNETIAFEEVENALAKQIGDDADMVAEIKAVSKMYTFVAVALVVGGQSGQHAQLNPRGISVFLDRSNDFDGTTRFPLLVVSFDDFTKGALAQEFDD